MEINAYSENFNGDYSSSDESSEIDSEDGIFDGLDDLNIRNEGASEAEYINVFERYPNGVAGDGDVFCTLYSIGISGSTIGLRFLDLLLNFSRNKDGEILKIDDFEIIAKLYKSNYEPDNSSEIIFSRLQKAFFNYYNQFDYEDDEKLDISKFFKSIEFLNLVNSMVIPNNRENYINEFLNYISRDEYSEITAPDNTSTINESRKKRSGYPYSSDSDSNKSESENTNSDESSLERKLFLGKKIKVNNNFRWQ